MFKFLLYLFKNKDPDHIMTVKSRWALVYAIMATNALLYYMYTKSEDNYPTDPESLKKQIKATHPEQMYTIKVKGLKTTEIIDELAESKTEILDVK